jgi:hypothetical protein
VALSILINSTTQISLKAETGVMNYIKLVNSDNVINYELSLALLSMTASFALVRVHFKEWNPWTSNNKEESNLNPLIPWKDLNFPDQPPNGILVGSS